MSEPASGVDLRELGMMDALKSALTSALEIQIDIVRLPPYRWKFRLDDKINAHIAALRAGVRLAYGDDDDPPASAGGTPT